MAFHGGFVGVVIAMWFLCRHKNIAFPALVDFIAPLAPVGLALGRLGNFINQELWGRPTDVPWAVAFPGETAQSCAGVVGLCGRHPSQLYEALLEGILLGSVLIFLAWKRGWLRFPGSLTGLFLAGYGSARFLVEFFRQPDMQFVTQDNPIGHAVHWAGYGLTMGQLLSLPMIILGAALIVWSRRRVTVNSADLVSTSDSL